MRQAAQRSLALQDAMPADEALHGYRHNAGGKMMLAALRAWEKARGINTSLVPRRRQATPVPAPKKTREELLARKRETACKRWAEMDSARKAKELARIKAWKHKSGN
jgi:hypothetical protein